MNLQPANPNCRNCGGRGFTLDQRYRSITHENYTVRWTCWCRKRQPEPEPLPKPEPHEVAWLFESPLKN